MSAALSKPRGRARFINAFLVLVAFGLLAWTIWSNRTEIRGVLGRRPNIGLLAQGFAVYMVALLLTFVRWYLLVRALDLPFRVRDALRLGFIGNVFNLVIPGAVGGDVIKAVYLCREQAKKTQAVASMVIDRIVGLLGLFLLAGLTGLGAWSGASPSVRLLIEFAWAAVVAGFVGLAILFTPALYRPFSRLFAGRGRLEVMFTELVTMASAYRRKIGVVIGTLAMATTIHALYVVAFVAVSRALFPKDAPSVMQHYLIVPLVLFSMATPVPFGALGVSEQVSGQLFKLVNHPGGAVAMMGYRVLMYAGGLVSACVYLANIGEVRSLSKPDPTDSDFEAGLDPA